MKTKPKRLSVLSKLIVFIKPYPLQVLVASIALVFTAAVNLLLVQGAKYLVDQGFIQQSSTALNQGIAIIMVLIIASAVGTFCRFYLVSWLGERVTADIREKVFNHLLTLDTHYFETNKSGEIMSRLTTDTTLLQNIIGSSASMALRSLLIVAGGIVMMFATNMKLSLIVLISVPLVLTPIMLFGRRVRGLSRRSQDSIADLGSHAGEIIRQIKTVQSYVRETFESNNFKRQVETAFTIALRRILQRALLIAVVMILVFCAIAGMLWVGGHDVLNGDMTGGELSAFIIYAVMVAMGVGTISEVMGELQRAAGATERLVELLEERATIKSPITSPPAGEKVTRDIQQAPVNQEVYEQTPIGNRPTQLGKATVAFKSVYFSYPSRPDNLALDNFCFTLDDGVSLALVGSSGAGKSTVFELMQRFYDPQSGEIYIGGHNIKNISPQLLRSWVGIVPQQPVLFSADVAYNIRYGNTEATELEIRKAAEAANALEFIEELPNGFATDLGEQGVRLSGGQKQRIAIARAIINNSRIMLLDEATSALDSDSERQVQTALNRLMKNRTTIVIAHRLSTVKHVDLIGVVDRGRLVDMGTHEALIETSAIYQKQYAMQFQTELPD
ncbi:ABC transporter ATP-binding protein/permease [Aurantivibrio plasticivorans]